MSSVGMEDLYVYETINLMHKPLTYNICVQAEHESKTTATMSLRAILNGRDQLPSESSLGECRLVAPY